MVAPFTRSSPLLDMTFDTLDSVFQQNIRFLDTSSQTVLPDIKKELTGELLREINPVQFEENTIIGLLNRQNWKPVVGEFLPLYSGMSYDPVEKTVRDPFYVPNIVDPEIDTLFKAVEAILERYQAKSVGVHLSGGFDSSLIIGILHYLQIPVTLIGMTTDRYEFRTERHVQNLLIERYASAAHLFDYEDFLPNSGLGLIPPSQHPDMECGDKSDMAIAKKCQEMGVDLVFSGEGGDILFGDRIPKSPSAWTFKIQILEQNTLSEMVYAPHNVRLLSLFSDPAVADYFYTIRRGQEADPTKVWARRQFREFIPDELAQYTYCSDFWGLYIDGFNDAVSTITKLHDDAFEITRHPYFKRDNLDELLKQDLYRCDQRLYQRLESRVTLASWLSTLFRCL